MNIKISNYYLDNEQQQIVLDKSKYLLVVAGAGSGKTLTILGKIKYLLEYIKKEEILCISFTRESSNSLKEKIKKEFNIDIEVYTFHKLALQILKNENYKITDTNTLKNIIHKYIFIDVLKNKKHMQIMLKYFKIKYKNKKHYINFIENNKNIEMLEKLIETFIHLFKCNNYKLESFLKFKKQAKLNILKYNHIKCFLIIVLNIYIIYEKYKLDNNEIDFDDMIIKATNKVKEKGIDKKYKYIIIDEYQDTSYVRFLLVKNIIEKTNSNLMVVGDDFQSIYRFTGCDLSLFLDFKKYFRNAKIMKIQNTYRNSRELIEVASKFIMKNKKQIKKKLKSDKTLNNPIKIIYYDNINQVFLKLIQKIDTKILVLGRNNNDINLLHSKEITIKNNKLIYLKDKTKEIKYLTVHKSKGLEEENVIIINMENKLTGFPNQIKDNKMLKFVSKQYEKYPYSEERRLFYVALTRTKNNVYILTPKKNESIFIKEIKKYKFVKKINL